MKDQSFNILVREASPDQFTAQAIGFPELRAEAPTEAEAVQRVREALAEFLASAKLVEVSLNEGNPWRDAFGSASADPDFQIDLEEIRKHRRTMDRKSPDRDQPDRSDSAEPPSRSKAKRKTMRENRRQFGLSSQIGEAGKVRDLKV